MSKEELDIFDTLSPQSQFKYLKNAYNAFNKSLNLYPSSTHNGKGDAFRHAYFNALNVVSIGKYYAEKLSTAHENKPYKYAYEYKEKNMDLFNNNTGRNYGELRYLSPLGDTYDNIYRANWARHDSKLIPTNQ